jgi:hypothetical protein
MQEQVIVCPYCKKEIPLTEALSHQIRGKLKTELEEGVREKEESLAAREKAVEKLEQSMEEEVSKRLRNETKKLETEVKKKIEDDVAVELRDLKAQVKEKDDELEKARKAELALRKDRRKLEDEKEAFELKIARELDEERKKIEDEAIKKLTEQQRLKDRENEEKLSAMRNQIEDLKRRAEQGSQQAQGEALELELEDMLKLNFSADDVQPVPKGMRGADIIQRVHSPSGRHCGTIIWESKRTKLWSKSWIQKLKHDQREVKAEIAVIVSTALPKEMANFGNLKGVWITNYECALGLATVLRESIIQVGNAKAALVDKGGKMDLLYNYLCGPAFVQKVEGVVEAFLSMKSDLDSERRAITGLWAKREQQIKQVITNICGMYGDMQGIIGSSLPQLKSIDLKALPPGGGP